MEVIGSVIFFGGLIALLIVVVRGGLSRPKKPVEPDLVFGLGRDELRIYIFEDGWSEVERTSEGKVLRVWGTYAWDELEVREILAEAGATGPELGEWARQIVQTRPRP